MRTRNQDPVEVRPEQGLLRMRGSAEIFDWIDPLRRHKPTQRRRFEYRHAAVTFERKIQIFSFGIEKQFRLHQLPS